MLPLDSGREPDLTGDTPRSHTHPGLTLLPAGGLWRASLKALVLSACLHTQALCDLNCEAALAVHTERAL